MSQDQRLKSYVETLRAVARQAEPADGMEKVEELTKAYLQSEIAALEAGIKRALDAIEIEGRKKAQGEDWGLIKDYIKSCLEKLPSVFEMLFP